MVHSENVTTIIVPITDIWALAPSIVSLQVELLNAPLDYTWPFYRIIILPVRIGLC